MSNWLTPLRSPRFQRAAGRIGASSLPKRGLRGLVNPRSRLVPAQHSNSTSRAQSISSAWSANTAKRVQQVNQHVQKTHSRSYASASEVSSPGEVAKIICTTKEHSPGHNVTTLSISNPSKLNIVNSPLMEELIKTCQEISKDDSLRAVVLTGAPTAAGKAASFIGGADIREMSQMSSYEQARTFITRVHHACAALRDVPVPVIARVHGFSLGAGLEIMASCDLRIATKDSVLGMPEVKIGLPSVVEAAYLPGLIGWGRTRRFLYLAENISGTEAEKWGLVEKVVDDEAALDQVVNEWVDMLVAMGPKCIRSQKRLMQKWENSTVDEAIKAGVDALAETFEDGGKEPKQLMGEFLGRKR